MSNSVEIISTQQVLVTQISEQVVEVTAPSAPATVEVITAGPQGPSGGVSTLAALNDVDVTARTQNSVLYYDAVNAEWKGDDINTILSITDGGNW